MSTPEINPLPITPGSVIGYTANGELQHAFLSRVGEWVDDRGEYVLHRVPFGEFVVLLDTGATS